MTAPAPDPQPRREFGVERLIPLWSTNPDFPPGQPYRGGQVDGPYPTREAAADAAQGWEPGTWRVMVRTVTEWEPADERVQTADHQTNTAQPDPSSG